MAGKIYRPARAWWRDVATLDEKLFRRGERDRSDLLGKIANQHKISWTSGEKVIAFGSTRMFAIFGGQHLGSMITCIERAPVAEVRSLNLGTAGLYRTVSYNPVSRTEAGHKVRDQQPSIPNLDVLTTDETEVEAVAAMLREADRETRTQHELGFAALTAETYEFILDTLRQGEEATRPY